MATSSRQPARPAREADRPLARMVTRWTCTTLWLRIQLDAFRLDPLGYLQAVGWRARGLRVRSRNRIAALSGRSPLAYRFWISCREPRLQAGSGSRDCDAPLFAIIDARAGAEGLRDTVASLPSDISAVVIGADFPGLARIETISELVDNCRAGTWLCPLSPGDRLAPDARSAYAKAIAGNPETDLFYADDDLVDPRGERANPHFKPEWNPELFEHHDFVTGACVLRIDQKDIEKLGEANWPPALVRLSLGKKPPRHLPYVLHHRRTRPQPVIPMRPPRVATADLPSISVIVPTRNGVELLRKCIHGLRRTDYPHLQLIVIDNGSDEGESVAFLDQLRTEGTAILRIEGAFNYSALNNAAVGRADGPLLCFLNNDIEILENDWLALLYPDRTVQHAGVFTGIGGGAAHAHRLQKENDHGYFDRARLPQRVTAVTGACLVVSREKFLAVGGFDEENFAVAFNDIDLCLKLNARGWQSFYEPRATLIHHESKSRGSDRAKENRIRFAEELAALKRIWRTDQEPDRFHHPNLSPFCEQFVIAV